MFSPADVADLQFIGNAQELGFSLREIRDLVALRNTRHPDCGRVEQMLEDKIASVRANIAALRKLERELERTMIRCQMNLRNAERDQVGDCPALSKISHAGGRKRI